MPTLARGTHPPDALGLHPQHGRSSTGSYNMTWFGNVSWLGDMVSDVNHRLASRTGQAGNPDVNTDFFYHTILKSLFFNGLSLTKQKNLVVVGTHQR